MSTSCFFSRESRIASVHIGLILVEEEELAWKHPRILHSLPNIKMQGYLLNIHRHAQ
jgi:hypothetical protein